MNNIVRAALRSSSLKALTMPSHQRFGVQNAGFTRSLWHMSKIPSTIKYIEKNSLGCTCGCGARFAHTEGKHSANHRLEPIFIALNMLQRNITSMNNPLQFHRRKGIGEFPAGRSCFRKKNPKPREVTVTSRWIPSEIRWCRG